MGRCSGIDKIIVDIIRFCGIEFHVKEIIPEIIYFGIVTGKSVYITEILMNKIILSFKQHIGLGVFRLCCPKMQRVCTDIVKDNTFRDIFINTGTKVIR